MSVYIIAQINVNNREEYDVYVNGFDEVFTKHKGILMAVDEDPVVLEGDWPYKRTVLMSFRSEEDALRWYESPEYQELAVHRRNSSEGNIVMIKRLGR